MYTFSEIVNNVAVILQRSQDTDYKTKIKQWINFSQENAFRAYDYYEELESTHSFTTVNGTESYYLPSVFDKPLRIFDMTNNNKLKIVTEENYQEINLSNIQNARTGKPNFARIYGISAIKYPISVSGVTIKVKSSSAMDNNNPVIRIEGFMDASNTIYDYENITLSSVSPTTYATASSPKTFYKITRITKSNDTFGYITVADSSGNVLANISSTERQSRSPELRLGIIPDGSYAFRVLYKRRINKLVDDNDYPFVDADEFMIYNSVAFGLSEEKESTDRSQMMFQKANEALMTVIRNQQARLGPDFQHKMINKASQSHRV